MAGELLPPHGHISSIDFSLPPEKGPNRREMIEILDDENNEILDKYI
jgi:hypothetical protein